MNNVQNMRMSKRNVCAVDLFCGVGGLTYGLRKAGIKVRAGIDNDSSCQDVYTQNNRKTDFILADIKKIKPDTISKYYKKSDIKVLVGCAPCQPFSSHTRKNWGKGHGATGDDCSLLQEFSRIMKKCQPDIISIENVPGLKRHKVFEDFLHTLKKDMGFEYSVKIVFCPEYGVPQTRRRLVLLASRFGKIDLIPPIYTNKNEWPTVGDFIKTLPPLEHGTQSTKDPCHWSLKLTDKNLERIKQSIPGGSWRDWDKALISDCHKKAHYPASYGRMQWNGLSPTVTTQFCYYSTGRFGHPEQNRAISLREGALLQTFPRSYNLQSEKNPLIPREIARHTGNAVPVYIGWAIGKSMQEHIDAQY